MSRPALRPTTWADRDLHVMKRELSRLEKASLVNTRLVTGQACVMPSVPGTEIEELIAVGFHPRLIQAVEEQQGLADALYEHYWDEVSVHWEEISTFLRRSHTPEGYSYIHLDYCGHLRPLQIEGIEAAIAAGASSTRLRISVLSSRRGETQHDLEYMLAERIFANLAQAAQALDRSADYAWATYLEPVLAQLADPTVAIAAICVCNAIFGLGAYTYTDACVAEGLPFFPTVAGRYRIVNMHRYHYHEPANANVMSTIWINFGPRIGSPSTTELAMEELIVALRTLGTPSIPYANPALFR